MESSSSSSSGGRFAGGSSSLKDLSKRFRHTLSDPNYVSTFSSASLAGYSSSSACGGSGSSGSSLLELRGLARRFGLKFNALRGRAVYLSTEAFYLEIKDSGEARLHVLSPESIEVLPQGEDLLGHLKGLMELRPRDWVELSRLQGELKNLIGDDLIPRVGGTPAKILFSPSHDPLQIRPQEDHFLLVLTNPFPLAEELLYDLTKASGDCAPLGTSETGQTLLGLICGDTSASALNINLPDQRHRYYLCPYMKGLLLHSIPFSSPSQVPEILRLLKHQALYNSLISSCGSPGPLPTSGAGEDEKKGENEEDHVFEVSSLSLDHISVSFEHPDTQGIHALEISLSQGGPLSTKLFFSSEALASRLGNLNDTVLEKLRSIPLLMRMILKTSSSCSRDDEEEESGSLGRLPGDKAGEESFDNSSSSSSSSSSSYQVMADPLNAKRPQEVGCIPGAKGAAGHHHPTPTRLSKSTLLPIPSSTPSSNPPTPRSTSSPAVTTAAGNSSTTAHHPQTTSSTSNNNSKRKLGNSEESLKPCVSITPVNASPSESSTASSSAAANGSKVGIEIIPLGGSSSNKYSSSKSSSSSPRDIKRSLSEDDKRINKSNSSSNSSGKKDKKRRHPSPLAGGHEKSSGRSGISCLGSSSKKLKTSSLEAKESLKLTLKSKNPTPPPVGGALAPTNTSSSSSSSPKQYGGGSKGSSPISKYSSSSSTSKKSSSKERSALEEEEVKRLLGGGKLLNKTFQIPKLSSSSAQVTSEGNTDKKGSSPTLSIPSLMSLQPSLFPQGGKEGSGSTKGGLTPSSSSSTPRFSPSNATSSNCSVTLSKSPSGGTGGGGHSPRGGGGHHPPGRRGSPSSSSKSSVIGGGGDVVLEHIS